MNNESFSITRRNLLLSGTAVAASIALPTSFTFAANAASQFASHQGEMTMATLTTKDGADIFYKDWGPKDAQPIMLSLIHI